MDNSNSSDSQNSQNPVSPFGTPVQHPTPQEAAPIPPSPPSSIPDWSTTQQATSPFPQSDTWPTPAQPAANTGPISDPSSNWNPPAQSIPAAPTPIQPGTIPDAVLPTQPEPTPADAWVPSSQPDISPIPDQPAAGSSFQTPSPVEPTLPMQPEPAPTETQLTSTFTPPPEQPLSPLDNPMEAPIKPPPIDGSPSIQPSWMNVQNSPTEDQSQAAPPTPAGSAPTDLSHLITNNPSQTLTEAAQESAQPAPETLVIPSSTAVNPEVPNLPTEEHKGIPKWLIGLGAGLLILVLGASAYLILGIGQSPKTTTSLPATIAPKTAEIKPPLPIATPTPIAQPAAATGSANFGELDGSTKGTQATSAADLLRQRQQQGR